MGIFWTRGWRNKDSVLLAGFMGLMVFVLATLWAVAAEPPATPTKAVSESQSKSPAQDAQPATDAEAPWKMFIKVLDEVTGEPIPKPLVILRLRGNSEVPITGDDQGDVIAEIPAKSKRFVTIRIEAPNYVPVYGAWVTSGSVALELPDAVTVSLEKGISVGGRVVDEQGKPVPGAEVEFSASRAERNGIRTTAMFYPTFFGKKYITDADGRWTCPVAPKDFNQASIRVRHPDFVQPYATFGADVEQLKSFRHVWSLDPGFTLRGRITNPSGEPLEGVVLGYGELNIYGGSETYPQSDAEGNYTFPRIGNRNKPSDSTQPWMTVTAIAPGWAPQMQVIPGFGERPLGPSTEKERIVDFVMQPGVTQRITAKDSQGKPAANASVFIDTWGLNDSNALVKLRDVGQIPQRTDENGVWEWTSAPSGAIRRIRFGGSGFASTSFSIPQTGSAMEITLPRPQVLTGKVIDADSQEPIERFRVEIGFVSNQGGTRSVYWAVEGVDGQAGRYQFVNTRETAGYAYRAVADGYSPAESETIEATEGERTLNFELLRLPEDKP